MRGREAGERENFQKIKKSSYKCTQCTCTVHVVREYVITHVQCTCMYM